MKIPSKQQNEHVRCCKMKAISVKCLERAGAFLLYILCQNCLHILCREPDFSTGWHFLWSTLEIMQPNQNSLLRWVAVFYIHFVLTLQSYKWLHKVQGEGKSDSKYTLNGSGCHFCPVVLSTRCEWTKDFSSAKRLLELRTNWANCQAMY